MPSSHPWYTARRMIRRYAKSKHERERDGRERRQVERHGRELRRGAGVDGVGDLHQDGAGLGIDGDLGRHQPLALGLGLEILVHLGQELGQDLLQEVLDWDLLDLLEALGDEVARFHGFHTHLDRLRTAPRV